MNWLTNLKTINVLTGLVLLSALFSCGDPGQLGIDLIDEDENLGVLYTEIPLDTRVVRLDSIDTTNKGTMMTGNHFDTDFGGLDVQSYVRILPPAFNPEIPESVTEADSVRMNLNINYFFGQSPVEHNLSVHELTDQIEGGRVFYSVDSKEFDPVSVTDTTFEVSRSDTLLNINLDGMKDKLLFALKDYESDSAGIAEFLEVINGLTLITPQSNAVLGFDLTSGGTSAASSFILYYTTNDTVVNTVELRYSTYFNQITPDYTGTELEGVEFLTDFTTVSGKTYIQAGSGLVAKVDFSRYFEFLDNDTTGTIVINEAEFVMDNLQGIDQVVDPPQQLSFFYTDDTNEIIRVGEAFDIPGSIQADQIYITASRNNLDPFNTAVRSVLAELDTADLEYSPEITMFLQFQHDGSLGRDDTNFIFSIPYSFVNVPTTVLDYGRNIDRFIVEPNDLRLQIFYTRLR